MANQSEVIAQLDALLDEYEPTVLHDTEYGYGDYLGGNSVDVDAACTRLSAAVERFTRPGSSYRTELKRINDKDDHSERRAVFMIGLVKGLRADYADGYLRTLEELVHADLFADFLEMGKELLDKGFKDPAAVLAGSVLESHVRQLAEKAGIPVTDGQGKPRNAEAINADLGKHVYGTGEQKSVTAWLDLRNDAAHGHYDKYDHKQVALLIESVRAFMGRWPA